MPLGSNDDITGNGSEIYLCNQLHFHILLGSCYDKEVCGGKMILRGVCENIAKRSMRRVGDRKLLPMEPQYDSLWREVLLTA